MRRVAAWLWGAVSANVSGALAFLIVVLGGLLFRYPKWTGDSSTSAPQTAATLVGALWGSAAVLFGAWLSERASRHREADLRAERAAEADARRKADEEARRRLENISRNAKIFLLDRFINITFTIQSAARTLTYIAKASDKQPTNYNYGLIRPMNFIPSVNINDIFSVIDAHHAQIVFRYNTLNDSLISIIDFWSQKMNGSINDAVAIFIMQNIRKELEFSLKVSEYFHETLPDVCNDATKESADKSIRDSLEKLDGAINATPA